MYLTNIKGIMEISLLKVLLNKITSFFVISSRENINFSLAHKYYGTAEGILKLLMPILNSTIDSEVASEELLQKAFAGLSDSIDQLRKLYETWEPFSSKIYFVLQAQLLIAEAQSCSLEILELLASSNCSLRTEASLTTLQHSMLKIKSMNCEPLPALLNKAIKDQVEGSATSSDSMAKIADSFSLKSNQELLIELVALDKLKENVEQAKRSDEIEYIEQIIALVSHMHESLVMMKHSESCTTSVTIPPDFCCPLSLELMRDPVIVSSGQTYERAFIRNWIDLGLTVCPKTRQTLAHTNLVPNYTVKAFIANWCESNQIKLVDPVKPVSLECSAPRNNHIFPHSRANNSTSPDSSRSFGSPSPRKDSFSSTAIQIETTSRPRPHSSSEEESLAGSGGNRLDVEQMSLESSEDGNPENSGKRSIDSISHFSMPLSTSHVSSADDEDLHHGHNRTSSAPTMLSSDSKLTHVNAEDDGNAMSSSAAGVSVSSAEAVASDSTPPSYAVAAGTRPSSSMWRRSSEAFVPRIVSSPSVGTRADIALVEEQVRKLVENLKNTSIDLQREASAEIRLLAKHNMDNRIVIANCGAINVLVDLLRSVDRQVQENAVTALLNLSINDNNKSAIANASAIEPLIHVLETGSAEAKENSAATLFSLSVMEDNKIKIGNSGAIQPLVDLLGNGTPRGKKDAATALFNLSIHPENKTRIVQAGAVRYLVDLMDPAAGMVDKAVAVLSNLSTIQEGRVAIGQEEGIPVLVEVVELGSARGKENAAAALLQLCTNSGKHCNMVLQEGAVPPLVALSQSGTPRAREKAQALLSYFRNQRNAGRN
ncbi:unnamed protein product [Cuscuta epithymum]|uniref:RING-type E3 ubiquitin transferase n=1 Tax=Cuscuta epithymum TaxID=186058 RepID=A0AAV0CQ43_9ASTE|nr:unnamed protein product [Cuscuta epithymum]CAH9134600.1 unnamed protein product [Cuscuta epithymum]